MNWFKSEHYSNEPIIVKFEETWYSSEYYEVRWKWTKPTSIKEKIFGTDWHYIYEYNDYRFHSPDSYSQWRRKAFRINEEFKAIVAYVKNNIHTYKELDEYFKISETNERYRNAVRRYNEKVAHIQELKKEIF